MLLAACCLVACQNDDACETHTLGDTSTLSDEAKSYIANYADAERIIFEDESGAEVIFECSPISAQTVQEQTSGFCADDPSTLQPVIYKAESLYLSLDRPNSTIGPIYVSLWESPLPNVNLTLGEWVTVTSNEPFLGDFDVVDQLLSVRPGGSQLEANFYDSLQLRDKTFYHVYEAQYETTTPKLDIKYTRREGIIYIGDPGTAETYVYKRKE